MIYVPFVTLSTQQNEKPLQRLKSFFYKTINCNKYQKWQTLLERNWYLDYSIDPSFQGVNKLFVLSFENDTGQESYKRHYLSPVEIKEFNVMIDGRNFFDQPLIINLRTYDNIQKIATGQRDDCTTGCLLDYLYFKNYTMIAIDLSKQQKLDVDQKVMQQINFTRNLDRSGNRTMFFIIEEAKEFAITQVQNFVKLWQQILQLILNYQNLSCIK